MLGRDLGHHVINHVDETVRLIRPAQVVASISLAKFLLESVLCHDVDYLHSPDVLDGVEDARAHWQLHLNQSYLLDRLVKVLANVVLGVVEDDVLRLSKYFATYRLVVVHVPADPLQELDDFWLLRALDDLVVHRTGVRVHRPEDTDPRTATRQPATDLLAHLLPQISRPVPVVRRPVVDR